MPSVCVCNCGMDVEDDELCVDWSVIGMHSQCATGARFTHAFAGFVSSTEWFDVRTVTTNWTNTTCRTHRALVRAQIPYVLMKLGENNSWQVRAFLDGAIGAPPAIDNTRLPELHWSTVWSGGLPVGTDGEQQTPGSTTREFIVPPGETLFTTTTIQVQLPVITTRPQNLLDIGATRVSLSAWPSKTDTGSGRTC